MSIILFDEVCFFDSVNNKTIMYGHFQNIFEKIEIDNIDFNIVFCKERKKGDIYYVKNWTSDFYIEIEGTITSIPKIRFIYKDKEIVKTNITLQFPFENCDLSLDSDSAIISTISKDYSSRLEEWIDYNLNLGFSGIVIFNNDMNKENTINEKQDCSVHNGSTSDICQKKKYKGKVWEVKMNYSPIKGTHWNNIQRITLHIGVNAFRNKCSKIALIDADEFIYLPNHSNILDFLKKYKGRTITMRSNILTNKANNDIIDNNILDLCMYVGEDRYLKILIDTSFLMPMEFIIGPHHQTWSKLLDKDEIIHYHCWVNSRYEYNEEMPKIEFLKKMKQEYTLKNKKLNK